MVSILILFDLVFSGCITSAESVLITQQSVDEFLSVSCLSGSTVLIRVVRW